MTKLTITYEFRACEDCGEPALIGGSVRHYYWDWDIEDVLMQFITYETYLCMDCFDYRCSRGFSWTSRDKWSLWV
jgi:hypothetical protein